MQAFENECMREILRVPWTRTLTTTTAYQLAGTTTVLLHHVKTRKMKYFGHILRQTEGLNRARSNDRINRRSWIRGRPRTSWIDNIFQWSRLRGSRQQRER